jgi:hypothetical protein
MSDPSLLETLKANLKYPEVVKAILAEKDLEIGEALIWASQNGKIELVKDIIKALGDKFNFRQNEVWQAMFLSATIPELKNLFWDRFNASTQETIDITATNSAFFMAAKRLNN